MRRFESAAARAGVQLVPRPYLVVIAIVAPWAVIESFTGENQAIATAASIWRALARTQDEIAVDGLAFLRTLMPAA